MVATLTHLLKECAVLVPLPYRQGKEQRSRVRYFSVSLDIFGALVDRNAPITGDSFVVDRTLLSRIDRAIYIT